MDNFPPLTPEQLVARRQLADTVLNKALSEQVAELVDVLRAVDQQFTTIYNRGQNFPDGFDARVVRWVRDAVAAHSR